MHSPPAPSGNAAARSVLLPLPSRTPSLGHPVARFPIPSIRCTPSPTDPLHTPNTPPALSGNETTGAPWRAPRRDPVHARTPRGRPARSHLSRREKPSDGQPWPTQPAVKPREKRTSVPVADDLRAGRAGVARPQGNTVRHPARKGGWEGDVRPDGGPRLRIGRPIRQLVGHPERLIERVHGHTSEIAPPRRRTARPKPSRSVVVGGAFLDQQRRRERGRRSTSRGRHDPWVQRGGGLTEHDADVSEQVAVDGRLEVVDARASIDPPGLDQSWGAGREAVCSHLVVVDDGPLAPARGVTEP